MEHPGVRTGSMEANRFVVPHIHEKQVRLAPGAVPGDGQNNMGIDPLHRGINDFETRGGVLAAEHDFQNAAETKRGIRTPSCRRFPENENSERTGLLFLLQPKATGCPATPLSSLKQRSDSLSAR